MKVSRILYFIAIIFSSFPLQAQEEEDIPFVLIEKHPYYLKTDTLTGETKEEHIKNKAEAEGITEEEAKAKMDANEKQSIEEGHPYEEWCGTLVEIYLRKQQLPLDADEKAQLDKNISDIKGLTNSCDSVLDTVAQRIGDLNET